VEARMFDYTQPKNLIVALQGVDKLLLISGNEIGQRLPQHKAVVEAAEKAGVKQIFYTSILHADTSLLGLAGEGHENKIYELAGDEAYTLAELAAGISLQTGKTIPYNNLTETQYADILKSFGLSEGVAKMLADSDTGAFRGGLFDNTKQLSALISRPTTPLAKVLVDALV
jgi:uncharacterized protein YbjT (DUF2867 family)